SAGASQRIGVHGFLLLARRRASDAPDQKNCRQMSRDPQDRTHALLLSVPQDALKERDASAARRRMGNPGGSAGGGSGFDRGSERERGQPYGGGGGGQEEN